MLNDDIARGISGVIRTTGRVAASAMRGALMFGALAFAVGAVVAISGPVSFGFATGGLLGAVDYLPLLFANPTFLMAAKWVIPGAELGAVVMGLTSLVPGISDGFGLKSLFSKKPDPTSAAIEPSIEPGLVPVRTPEPTIEQEAATAETSHVAALQAQRAKMLQDASLAGVGK